MNGTELLFKRPGEGSDNESADEGPHERDDEGDDEHPVAGHSLTMEERPAVIETARITIVDDD